MFTNRNLKTDNVGVPVEIDLSYDIGPTTLGNDVQTPKVNSSKWTFTRVSVGRYRLKAKTTISQRAVTHIMHDGVIAVPLATVYAGRLVPVTDAWSQTLGELEFKLVDATGATVVAEPPAGSRFYLRVKQEYAKVTQR
jgi:hypothetical protein